MARQNAPTSQAVNDSLPVSDTANSAELRPDSGWFPEFSRVAFDLSLTLNRTIILTSVMAIGAIALIYWGAYTERYLIMAGAMAAFALAMLAWVVANAYVTWTIISGSVRWWTARRNGTCQNDKP